MPNCCYCNKVFKDRQALGSHIKTHLDDSDEDSSQPIQRISQYNLIETTQVFNDQVVCKKPRVEQNSLRIMNSLNINESIEEQDQGQDHNQGQD